MSQNTPHDNVDILLATHNGAQFVEEQISSIFSQSYEYWHLIIQDDCSSDETLQIVESLCSLDPRVSIVGEGKCFGGAKENFFALLSHAESSYAMFCDQDDVWSSNKIWELMSEMKLAEAKFGKECPILVICDMQVVDAKLQLINGSFFSQLNFDPSWVSFNNLLSLNIAAGCSMMFNSALLSLAKKCSDSSKIEMHDWWMMLVASAFGQIIVYPRALVKYRQHESNTVGGKKYSPLRRLRNSSKMYESLRATIRQAEVFCETYSSDLSKTQRYQVSQYIKIKDEKNVISAIKRMSRADAWKKGERKLGQLFAILQMAFQNITVKDRRTN